MFSVLEKIGIRKNTNLQNLQRKNGNELFNDYQQTYYS